MDSGVDESKRAFLKLAGVVGLIAVAGMAAQACEEASVTTPPAVPPAEPIPQDMPANLPSPMPESMMTPAPIAKSSPTLQLAPSPKPVITPGSTPQPAATSVLGTNTTGPGDAISLY